MVEMRIWFFSLCLWITVPAVAADFSSLRDFAQRTGSVQAYGVYMLGHKVGWMAAESGLGKLNGRETARSLLSGRLSLQSGGATSTWEFREESHYALSGDGPLLWSREWEREGAVTRDRTATRSGNGLRIVANGTGEKPRRVPIGGDNVRQTLMFYRWLGGTRRAGDQFTWINTSLSESQVHQAEKYTYRSPKKIVWGGISVKVHQLRVLSKSAPFDADMRADAVLLSGRMGGVLDIRAEELKIAKQPGKGLDLMAASFIAADSDLGDTEQRDTLTLELLNLPAGMNLPSSPRQKVRRENGKVFVDLSRDLGEPATLSAAQKATLLAGTPEFAVDNAQIRTLARQITAGAADAKAKVAALRGWVFKNLRKTMASNASTALDVLRNRAGDCTEHTLLFVTLARAAGVPVRDVTGLAYLNEGKPQWGWHAWAEFHDGKHWRSVDPTWNQTGVDVGHLKFASGDDYSWIAALGRVRIRSVNP